MAHLASRPADATGPFQDFGPETLPPVRRIMIVLHDFAGGGTERVALALAGEWVRNGRSVTILCGSEGGPLRGRVPPGVEVEPCRPEIRRAPLSRARLGFELAAAAACFRPQVVFAPGNFHLSVMAVFALIDRSGALTCCKISNPIARAGRGGLASRLRGITLRRLTASLDVLVAMSPSLRDECARALGSDCVVTLWEPIAASAPRGSGPPARDDHLILAVGRLEPQKDFSLAIRAMQRLPDHLRLVILGEGGEREALAALARKLGVSDRVLMPGHVQDVRPWMDRARCLIMTSRYEGYPAALVEAVAAGLPAVLTPFSSAVDEILSCLPGSGRVVAAEPESLAAAVIETIAGSLPVPHGVDILARHEPKVAAMAYLDMFDRKSEAR